MAVPSGIHTQLNIGILADVSIFETSFGRFRTVFMYALLDLTLGIRFEPVLGGLILIISEPNHITILKQPTTIYYFGF